MIVKLNKSYFDKYRNQIILLLSNIQFISNEFACSICKGIRNDFYSYSNYSFLYIENDILLGMVLAKPIGSYIFNKSTCEVKYLSVNSDFKGKGIASSLVEHLKMKCSKSFDYLYLTVYENNSRAITFYKKMGFSRYILNNKPQNVLRDGDTPIEHIDFVLFVIFWASHITANKYLITR